MAGVFAGLQVHDVQSPHPIIKAPLASPKRKKLPSVFIDINVRLIGELRLPCRAFAAQINRVLICGKSR